MEQNQMHTGNGARPAVEVLRSMLALREQKNVMKKPDYKQQMSLLWAQAELTVETSDDTLQKAAPAAGEVEQRGGATITHRPDVQYEAERNLAGDWRLDLGTDDREYLGRKLADDRKEGVPAADRILARLGFTDV